MAVISSTPRNAFNSCSTTLKTSMVSGTQTTGIVLNALIRNTVTVSYPATSGGILRFYRGGLEEHIGYGSATVDATTKEVTLVDVTRDLPWNDGTSFTTAGAGIAWPAGTRVDLVLDARHMNFAAFRDLANTFIAKQTFSVPPRMAVYATSGDLPAGGNGDSGAYVTADGVFYDYIAGAWSQRATGTTPNGSTTVAGKFEEATVAEQIAATATGATGARLVPVTANMVTASSGASDEGKIVLPGSSGTFASGFLPSIPVSKGGTGLATLTANNLLVGAGTSSVTFIAPGIAGTTLVSGGTTATFKAPPALASTSASSTATTSNTVENIINQSYTIPAASVAVGDVFHLVACGTLSSGLGPTTTFRIKMGSTTIDAFSQGTSNNAPWMIEAWLTVRATGGSGTVVCNAHHSRQDETAFTSRVVSSPVTIDFTATQALQISAQGSANVSVTMTQFIVHKMSL